MIRLIGRRFSFASLLYVAFAAYSVFCLPRAPLIIALNALFLGMTISLTVTLTPMIARAIRDQSFDEVSQLTFSIVLVWCSMIMLRGNNAWARHYDQGGPTGNSMLIVLSIYFAMAAAIMQLTAPGFVDWKSRGGRRMAVWNIIWGLVIAALVVWFQINGDPQR